MSETTKPFTVAQLNAGARLALIGVAVNFVLAVIKISAGIFGHSYVLIADGIESTLDIFSSLIIWFGLKVAAEPPDEEHPYGHGKAEPVAACVVSLTVMVAAVGLATESVREILTPHHGPEPFTLAVLVLVVAVKETLFRKVVHAGESLGSTAVKTDAWHHRADVITSIAAFIGISIALLGGKGWEPADDWAALFACGLIGWNGWNLLRPSFREIMDSAPPKELESSVRATASGVTGVEDVEKCRVRKMGLEFYVDIHIGVHAEISVREGHDIAHRVKNAVRTANPAIADVLVHVEPFDRTPRYDG